ncbi:MAG: 2-hydroxychromene-2-carboxylate isomerase [Nannocystaceae bacterium]|nr:2-hydroxychromene-2-carboxylate isomerase [Myxococcales bacterium]
MQRALRFHFDFISPYAYLAWQWIHELAAARGCVVEYRPVLFAALLDHHGQLGPAEVEPKRRYIFKHSARRAHALGVPFQPPPAHPFNPLLGLRVASIELPADARRRLIDALMRAVWGGGPGIEEPAQVVALIDAIGLDGAGLVAEAGAPARKQALRDATAAAIAEGVFGVPTVLVDGELFWGSDARDDLDAFLRGEDPLPADLFARWAHIQPSAVRPRSQRPQG